MLVLLISMVISTDEKKGSTKEHYSVYGHKR